MVSTRSGSGTPPPAELSLKFEKAPVGKEKKVRAKMLAMRTKSAAMKKITSSSDVGEGSGSKKRAMDLKSEAPPKRSKLSKKPKDVRN